MKKVILTSIVALGLFACSKQKVNPSQTATATSTSANVSSARIINNLAAKPIIRFKHTGVSQPGGPPVPPCEKPLGICMIFGIQAIDPKTEISEIQRADGYGTAVLDLLDETHLKLIPDTRFAYADGTIELEENGFIDEKLANQMGYKKVKLKKGVYSVNPNEGRYGSVILDVITINDNHN